MKTTKNRVKLCYDSQSLKSAIDAVMNGEKIYPTSKKYGIPETTLRYKIKGKSAPEKQNSGKVSILSTQVEKQLVDWCISCSRMGFGVTTDMLLDSVQKYVQKSGIETPFKDDRPGKSWYYGFMRRHKILSKKKAEHLNRARGSVTETKIRHWFREVRELIGTEFMDCMNDPLRVWNMDETGFCLSPKGGKKVIGERGKTVYEESSRSDKENITTLFTVSAAGTFAPPLTLFKYVRLPRNIVEATPQEWSLGRSENGWMNSKCFFEYFANVFIPYLKEHKITLPVVVFLDGHKSHLTLELSDLCKEHGIILVALYPNSTHILQPLDVAVFGPMKKEWKNICRQWRVTHDGFEISKENIPIALKSFLNSPSMAQNIKSGFRCTGLFPFNEDAVNYSKIVLRPSNEALSQQTSQVTQLTKNERVLFIEDNIDPDMLTKFWEVNDNQDWDGDEQYRQLFYFWRKTCHTSPLVEHNAVQTENEISVPSHQPVIEEVKMIESNDNFKDIQLDYNILTITEEDFPFTIPFTSNNDISHNSHEPNLIIKSETISPDPVSNTLKDILVWPKQPVSKSKRAVHHLPSVITSDKWRELQSAKEEEKRNAELDKENRKQQRMEKRKINEQTKKSKKIKIEMH
uniref:CSON002321 protein n=1 Tax=Culicoides sonorensis TaxID=179676 RepID=A0A336MFM0_CULSO